MSFAVCDIQSPGALRDLLRPKDLVVGLHPCGSLGEESMDTLKVWPLGSGESLEVLRLWSRMCVQVYMLSLCPCHYMYPCSVLLYIAADLNSTSHCSYFGLSRAVPLALWRRCLLKMQSPRWDNEAPASRGGVPPADYGGLPLKRAKDAFKQKSQRFRLPHLSDSQMWVLSTTVVYFLTLCVYYWAFFRHPKVVLIFTFGGVISCAACGVLSKRRFEVCLAACTAMALLLGMVGGLFSYANFSFYSWQLYTSRSYENVVPSEDPGIVADGGRVSFAKEAFLDQKRSVGFAAEDGRLYCIAPISSHSDLEVPVNFWAVGVDCCGLTGRFQCDAAPKQTGHGILLREESHMLFSKRQHFEDARRKSAATFGIQGVEDALFLRWVTKEQYMDQQRVYDREAAYFTVFTTLLIAAGSTALTWTFKPRDLATRVLGPA